MRIKNVLSAIAIALVVLTVGCTKDDDNLPPTVLSTSPTHNESNIALDKMITVEFSEAMDSVSINNETFNLKNGETVVAGTVSYSGTTATFTPKTALLSATKYTAIITNEAKDALGKMLEDSTIWSFTTIDVSDKQKPTVTSTSPANNELDIALNKTITVEFSEIMDSVSINNETFTLKYGETIVAGTISHSDTTAIFTPANVLNASTVYTVTVTTGVTDLAGNAIVVNKVWSFTTGTVSDVLAPTILSTTPGNNETDVAQNTAITINFSEAMNQSSVNNESFVLKQGATVVPGAFSYSVTSATFTPSTILEASTVYTATLNTGATDLAGNALAINKVWSFTTGTVSDVLAPTILSTTPGNNETDVAQNIAITITFSEAMNQSSVNNESFVLKQGATVVPGAFSYSVTSATFTPSTILEASTVYTATLNTGATDLAGNALAINKVWSFTTLDLADILAPTVVSTDPENNAADVAQNKAIKITFSEPMNSFTLNTSTFTLKQGGTAVSGTVSYTATTATFTPSSLLKASTVYTATMTTGAKDLSSNALVSNKVWSFTTLDLADAIAPTVISTDPENNETDVAQNKTITINFSEAMNSFTLNTSTFTLKQGENVVSGAVSYSSTSATFTPSILLEASTVYTATLNTGAKDLAGNALAANKVWSFTTKKLADLIAPTILSTNPNNNATNVAQNATITISFSEAMNPTSVNNQTFVLKQGTTVVSGTVSYAATTASFKPSSLLKASTVYTATLNTGATDIAGNGLSVNKVWSFTTESEATMISAVQLGSAANYVILAKTAINNNPTSAITGNLGLSPAATSYITGLSLTDFTGYATSSQITGKVYAADMVTPTSINLTTAVENMITAYNDAAGRPSPDFLELGTGNIGGKTLTSGLYKWTSTVTLPTDVTLSGSADDVWIFQISGDLNVSAAVNLTLIGGAKAENIFWQVAGEAIIGTTAHFEGIILSKTGITFQTGASFKGRALAQTAAILDANTVVQP
ncbi:MAG: Ig-like domain-containing protein [Prolixibacteraceae bacterium]